jgi:hypothetical protein
MRGVHGSELAVGCMEKQACVHAQKAQSEHSNCSFCVSCALRGLCQQWKWHTRDVDCVGGSERAASSTEE